MGNISTFVFTSETETVTKTKLNNLVANLKTEFNGSIDNDNIKAGAGIIGSKLDLSVAGSGQIAFPATANPSSDPNTLDEYEEGAWTIIISTTGGGESVGYADRSATYTKIGKSVLYNGFVILNAFSGGSGNITMGELPFTLADTQDRGAGFIQFKSGWTTIGPDSFTPSQGLTIGAFFSMTATGATQITTAHITTSSRVDFTGCYTANL